MLMQKSPLSLAPGLPRLMLVILGLLGAFLATPTLFAQNMSPSPVLAEVTIALPDAAAPANAGGEANLHLPDLNSAIFFNGAIGGHALLTYGLIFCALGVVFGLVVYVRLKNMAVHPSMLEVSELIYETCKTYLLQQGKFLLMLWGFIALVILVYFG